jgi:peptidoglycan/LPS O-acetylase OafA/YrhL
VSVHWRDGGAKSRKMWFAVFAIAVLALTFFWAAGREVQPHQLYSTFAASVELICGMFIVGNIGAKWVSTKMPATEEPAPKPPAKPVAKKPQAPEAQDITQHGE